MATITGLTAERMKEIEDASVVDGEIIGGNLILTKHDGTTIDAGPVIGPPGPAGPTGPISSIPGEVKLWPGDILPDEVAYGLWTWANGGVFNIADYPLAAANISPAWKTAHGQSDPGAGKFRVPDLRGLTPAGLDAMPVGSQRASRVTRSVAIVLAGKSGTEVHLLSGSEMPAHSHVVNSHAHGGVTVAGGVDHVHGLANGFAVASADGTTYAQGGTGFSRWTVNGNTSIGGSSAYSHAHGVYAEAPGTNAQGGSTSHENLQPTVFVPYIVKLDD